MEVMQLYNELQWDPGSGCVDFEKDARHACGSKCPLLEMILMKTDRNYHDAVGFNFLPQGKEYSLEDDFAGCINAPGFYHEFLHQLATLEAKLIALPNDVRNDVIVCLLGRGRCGCRFFKQDGSLMAYTNDCLEDAHNDYRDLFYFKRDMICKEHGVAMTE